MGKVYSLAVTTLREMIRERIFWIVIVMAAGLFALSFLMGALSFAEQRKILTDFGFLSIQIAALGVSLFSGAYILAKEVEKQTCLLILSRPVTRQQFILGKTLGLLALITLLMGALASVLWILLGMWKEPSMWKAFIEICIGLWFESVVILCAVILFSLVMRPVLALAAGAVVFLLGHWLGDLMFFAEKSQQESLVKVVEALQWVTPNLYRFNWKSAYFLENGISNSNFLWMIAHMSGWTLLTVVVTGFLFRRKDIV